MAKVDKNEFKLMKVELLNSGRKIKKISEEYQLNDSMLLLCKWEHEAKVKFCYSTRNV